MRPCVGGVPGRAGQRGVAVAKGGRQHVAAAVTSTIFWWSWYGKAMSLSSLQSGVVIEWSCGRHLLGPKAFARLLRGEGKDGEPLRQGAALCVGFCAAFCEDQSGGGRSAMHTPTRTDEQPVVDEAKEEEEMEEEEEANEGSAAASNSEEEQGAGGANDCEC